MNILSRITHLALPDLRPGYVRAFHDAVRRAIEDGKLTEAEIAELEKMKEESGLSDAALDAIRQELYLTAFAKVTERQDISDDEWDELEHIQDYLGLNDKDVARSKKELYRMRILSEIKKGNLPVLAEDGITLDPEELLHWKEAVDLMTGASVPVDGSSLHFGKEKKTDEGMLFITSKRIVFKGAEGTVSRRLLLLAGADCRINGMILHQEGSKPMAMRYREKGNHNVAGSIVLTVLEAARAH